MKTNSLLDNPAAHVKIFTTSLDECNETQVPSNIIRRRKKNNDFITITEVDYKNLLSESLNNSITYTESAEDTSSVSRKFLTDFPELNLAAVRLENLSPQIDSRTLHTTFALLVKLLNISYKDNLWWGLPLINIGLDSEVVLEWWHKDRKLDFDILGSNIDYMKVWGADIETEMEDGSIRLDEDSLTNLWKWITN